MAIPGQTQTLNDPGVGLVPSAAGLPPLVVGIASSGTENTLFSYNSITALKAAHGRGPAVEDAAELLQDGGPVMFLKLTQAAAGTISAITQSGGGPAITDNSSAPNNACELEILIILGGALGTATFKYSLDDGRSWSEVYTAPAGGNFVVPGTGIDLTLAAGSYVAGEQYSADTEAPTYTATQLSTAATAISASTDEFAWGVLSGKHVDASTASTLAAALIGHMATWESEFRFTSWIMDAGEDDEATTKTGFTAEDQFLCAGYGDADGLTAKPFAGYVEPKRGAYVHVAKKAHQAKMSTDLGWFGLGNCNGISSYSTTHGLPVSHDEFKSETMDASKFATLRSWPGRNGYYVTQGRMRSAAGSDFLYWQHARVMNVARRICYIAQQKFQNAIFRTNNDGSIDERDAVDVDAWVQRQLDAELMDPINDQGKKGHCVAVRYTVDRENDFQSSETVQAELAIKPFTYGKHIITQVGFAAAVE